MTIPALRYLASDQVRFHQDLSSPPRQIAHYRFLYVESGEGEFQISETNFHVSSGWLGLLAPGLRSNHYFDTEPVSYFFVEFASTLPLIDACFLECPLQDPQRSALIGLLKSIDSFRGDPDGCLLSAAARLMFAEDPTGTGHPIDERLTKVLRQIQLHPDRNPTVRKLASAASLSEPHLRRLFRTHLGRSPKQFLLRTRMEYAQRLLRFEGLRVGEVARLLGFSTMHQFSAQYRSVIGRPPSAERQSE